MGECVFWFFVVGEVVFDYFFDEDDCFCVVIGVCEEIGDLVVFVGVVVVVVVVWGGF